MPVLRKYLNDVSPRPLPHDWKIQRMALPEVQHIHWWLGGYDGSVAEGNYLFGAVTCPMSTSAPKPKRAGRRVKARARAEALRANARPYIPRPPRNTPTPSECSEIQHGYQEAFDFWLRAQFEDIPEEEYNDTAELFDELPGVSGYFRHLCLHTVTEEQGGVVLRKTY